MICDRSSITCTKGEKYKREMISAAKKKLEWRTRQQTRADSLSDAVEESVSQSSFPASSCAVPESVSESLWAVERRKMKPSIGIPGSEAGGRPTSEPS